MENLILKYGSHELTIPIPESVQFDTILPPANSPTLSGVDCVRNAIHHPISPINTERIKNARHICIAINDKTRPVPYKDILPPLLDYLRDFDVTPEKITYLVATGTHTPAAEAEMQYILSDELRLGSQIRSHDCDDQHNHIFLGTTSSGTEVEVNRLFYESDYRIVLGNIEPHHFMGYSGGVKTAAIGLTSRKTIRQNHSHLTSPLSFTGNFADNPCRVDVEEIGKMIGVDIALNLILNTNKQIMHALFGDPASVIKHGIPISENICQVKIQKPYDLVLVSPGGYPKDINFYQAHKAVTNAAALTKTGGRIILVAECREGSGSRPFQQFMTGVGSPDEVLAKFDQVGFEIGPHKAYLLARQLKRVRLSVYSTLSDDLASSLLLEPISLPKITAQFEFAGRTKSSIAVLPFGVNTVPAMQD